MPTTDVDANNPSASLEFAATWLRETTLAVDEQLFPSHSEASISGFIRVFLFKRLATVRGLLEAAELILSSSTEVNLSEQNRETQPVFLSVQRVASCRIHLRTGSEELHGDTAAISESVELVADDEDACEELFGEAVSRPAWVRPVY